MWMEDELTIVVRSWDETRETTFAVAEVSNDDIDQWATDEETGQKFRWYISRIEDYYDLEDEFWAQRLSTSVSALKALVDIVERLGTDKERLAYTAYIQNLHIDIDRDCTREFEEAFCGFWDTEIDFGQEQFDSLYGRLNLPYPLGQYLDMESFTSDLMMDYWQWDCGTAGIAIFRNI